MSSDNTDSCFPGLRLRRMRKNASFRNMFAAPMPGPEKFVWPVFVVPGQGIRQPVAAMPGQFRYSVDTLVDAVGAVRNMGINAVMLFGVIGPEHKSPDGCYAWNADGVTQQAIRALRAAFPELIIFADVCLCEYTSHGHCGMIDERGRVLNDPSLELLAKIALSYAAAGADNVAPSAMMDGQIKVIRAALESGGYHDTSIMSYSSKFASGMYGPFREAANSAPASGDRKSYQADWRNPAAALLESRLDEQEGADILMVKPALFYLDIIAAVKQDSLLPLAAYNVSGEYSMLIASSERNWGDLKTMVRESVGAISRSGADIILSYWANQYNQLLKD